MEKETHLIRRLLLPHGPFLLLLFACSRNTVEEPPPSAPAQKPPAAKKTTAPLPKGFRIKGPAEVTEPFLPPDAAWRFLVSELTTLRAEGQELLVTFDKSAFHATDRDGHRRTWRLPKGLTLKGVPAHALLRADTGIEAGKGTELQVVGPEEVTVVTARIDMGGNVQEFRLVAQAAAGFRSISTGGTG
jgi:hypothetical protein